MDINGPNGLLFFMNFLLSTPQARTHAHTFLQDPSKTRNKRVHIHARMHAHTCAQTCTLGLGPLFNNHVIDACNG